MSLNYQENKEQEVKKQNTSLLNKIQLIQFEKSILNIIEIDKDKDICKRKRNNSFSYLTVFNDKVFFKFINIQLVNKRHTDEIQRPYKKHMVVISSLKYVTDYIDKDITKEVDNLFIIFKMIFLIDIIFNKVRYRCLSIAVLNRNLKEYVDICFLIKIENKHMSN